ncbi:MULTISPECIES: hypothetical protein [unclassified Lactobacillus]|uniref:hypothetical protein n=1 Tax=unclassified Lactobacillus TaxID=2620435 RepID=UPI000EFAC5DC|nr:MULTISPECIES: hypothetical protein [unclassified Lactobacillus]RMC24438.1 hypothetical protein F5ESL0247_04500 [Lactobacillus sp. ESL0247]RMC28577.1 hypothetical protein F5ESL0246_04500 [Lactobacillus sp. ESL0246]RMC31769.1 hypothetical protein F5ESL0245_04505 [Lactobacillus sp. ESL0245]
MINKTQVLWGYAVIACVCHGLSEMIASLLKLNSGMITIIFFLLFMLKFEIKPITESDNPIYFRIEFR